MSVISWDLSGPPPRDHIDLVVPDYLASKSRLRHLEGVTTRLVQSQSIGYDGVGEVLPPGHAYANAAGVHEASTAELALALILASQRGLDDFARAQTTCHWAFSFRPSLADRRVLLLGYGGVGRAIEARLAPFEVDVVRVARHARLAPTGPVHGLDELPDLLPLADVVGVSLRLDDEAFLSRLAPGGLLVNVGRGPVVVTDDLVAAVASGRVRAALDVVEPEPLPPPHPLWALAGVLISPHVGGASSAMAPRVLALLDRQIERLTQGLEPLNVVLRS